VHDELSAIQGVLLRLKSAKKNGGPVTATEVSSNCKRINFVPILFSKKFASEPLLLCAQQVHLDMHRDTTLDRKEVDKVAKKGAGRALTLLKRPALFEAGFWEVAKKDCKLKYLWNCLCVWFLHSCMELYCAAMRKKRVYTWKLVMSKDFYSMSAVGV
jgi:hypothetical protein